MALVVADAPTRCGIYCRISSDDQRDALGVKRQERNARLLAEAKGWNVVEVFVDNDRSASKENAKRPEFDRLMAAVADGRIDVVLVQNQERLVRKPDELEVVMRALRKAGHTGVWTVAAGEVRIDSTNGRTMARVKGVFDIAYSEFISEKVREKKAELAERGLPAGGGDRPFGYESDRVTIREDEANLVREAACRLLAGESLSAVARDWNDRGVPTVRGGQWTPNVLRGMLVAPRITGLRAHKGEVVGEAVWPAILDRETWEKIVRLFADRQGRPRDVTNRKLLTGLLTCGRCGQPLWAGQNNGKATYACVRHESRPGCFLSIEASQLEALVVEATLQRLDDAKLPVTDADAGRTFASEVERLEAERDELASMKARGELTMSEWKTLRRGVTERLDEARSHLDAVHRDDERAEIVGRYMKPGALRRAWPKLAMADRRKALRAIIETITVSPAIRGRNRFDPERVDVTWRV